MREGSSAYRRDSGSLGWGMGRSPLQRHAQPVLGTAAQLGDSQLPSPSQIIHFCSLVANDVIKFIRKPSVINDRHSEYAVREALPESGDLDDSMSRILDVPKGLATPPPELYSSLDGKRPQPRPQDRHDPICVALCKSQGLLPLTTLACMNSPQLPETWQIIHS